LCDDYTKANLTQADKVMLDFVVKLTKDATRITHKDHELLHDVGFDDKAILQITLIASWFNYINRVADALGVGRE
jgi:alkylhydroperoxidase family enzyme